MVGDKNFNIEITAHGKTDASVGKLQQTLGKITDQLNKMQQAARQARQVANNLAMVGGVITGALGVAMNTAAKYNTAVADTNQKISNSFVVLQNEVANAVLPVYKDLANITTNLVIKFKNLDDALKNKIIRIAAVTAGIMVLSGVVMNLTARIVSLTASIVKMISVMASVAFANPWMAALTVIIGLVAGLAYLSYKFATDWNRYFEEKIKPVLVTFEIALLSVKAKINEIYAFYINILASAVKAYEIFADKLISSIPGGEAIFGGIKKAIKTVRQELEFIAKVEKEASEEAINDIYEKMTTGKSVIADGMLYVGEQMNNAKKTIEGITSSLTKTTKAFDLMGQEVDFVINKTKSLGQMITELRTKMKIVGDEGFLQGFKKGFVETTEEMSKFSSYGQEIAKQTANNIQSYFGDSFYAIFKGNLAKLEEAFSNFADSILRMIANMIAQYLVFSSLSGIFGANSGFTKFYMGTRHQGGYIPLAHTGRAFDEVDVRLQKGEGVVSRRGMNAIGKAGLDAINSGVVPTEQSQPVVINLQTWDAQDVIRNRNMITAIIQNAIQSNSSLRKVVKNA